MKFGFLDYLHLEFRLLLWTTVFVVMVALDFIWAKYNQATVNRTPWRAGAYAVAVYALGAIGVMSYSSDATMLVPACAGAFVGTFLSTRKVA